MDERAAERVAWQTMLQTMAVATEPIPTRFVARIGMDMQKKAVAYLLAKGFIETAGGEMLENGFVPYYRITDTGRVAVLAGLHRVRAAGRPRTIKLPENRRLAHRAVSRNPTSVFDLVRKPWTCTMQPPEPEDKT